MPRPNSGFDYLVIFVISDSCEVGYEEFALGQETDFFASYKSNEKHIVQSEQQLVELLEKLYDQPECFCDFCLFDKEGKRVN